MNYGQTVEWLYSRLPMFQRTGAAAYKEGLGNIISLVNSLGNPHNSFQSIHVAGTNGKGSVSSMLAAIFTSAGYKTGLFTSPHLKDYRERIRINGKMVSKKFVTEFVRANKKLIDEISPSFFELTTAIAFKYFQHEKVDIAIIETGMGGRLDSTNIINPLVSVITNIGFDHQQFLGNTLPKIAFEKAGIIKSSIPVIVGRRHLETDNVFKQKALSENTEIFFVDKKELVRFDEKNGIEISDSRTNSTIKCKPQLVGIYQQENISTVLKTLSVVSNTSFNIRIKDIVKGLENVSKLTGLKGRWQIIKKKPLIVADTAHNVDGILQVIKQVNLIKPEKLHIVLGMVSDKDINPVLAILPSANTHYYFCKPNLPRGLEAETLKEKSTVFGLKGNSYSSVYEAYSTALEMQKKNEMVLVTGSTFTVAEIL